MYVNVWSTRIKLENSLICFKYEKYKRHLVQNYKPTFKVKQQLLIRWKAIIICNTKNPLKVCIRSTFSSFYCSHFITQAWLNIFIMISAVLNILCNSFVYESKRVVFVQNPVGVMFSNKFYLFAHSRTFLRK